MIRRDVWDVNEVLVTQQEVGNDVVTRRDNETQKYVESRKNRQPIKKKKKVELVVRSGALTYMHLKP